jgi:ubiquitin carboxyl-terminal hydrolase 10
VRFSPFFPPRGAHFTGPDITVSGARQSAKPSRYTLYGVLYHHGMTSGGGHYSVDVLHPYGDGGNGEAWLHINNETVSKVGHEDVFRGLEDERAVDRSAYMLFYRHTSP